MRVWHWVRLSFILVVLIFSAYNGLVEGRNAFRSIGTTGHAIATATQLAYGVFAVLTLAALRLARRATGPLLVGWGITFAATMGLGPKVYAGSTLPIALLTGFLGLGVVLAVLWAWHLEQRRAVVPQPSGLDGD
jgi:hypothetical protein